MRFEMSESEYSRAILPRTSLREAGRHSRGSDASEVIRRLPNRADAYVLRAQAGTMLGQIPQALQGYSTAITLQPTAEAYCALGYDGDGRKSLTTCYQDDPNSQTRGDYEAEVNTVLQVGRPR